MHQQPTYTITFDQMAGVGPLTVTADQMDDQIHRAFLAADVIDDGHEFAVVIDIPAGTVVVRADGDVIEHGTITTAAALPARSAYWRTLADGLQVAGWVHDATTPMADGRTEELLLHPSGRQITAMTAADGTTELTMTGLTLEQVADAVTAAGLTGQSAAPTEVDALVDGITTLLDGPGGSTVGAEHAHVGGVIGGPGENEAECACGLIFGGFDSQAAALEFLDRHIADPEKTPEPTLQQRLAAELHRIADDIVRLDLPLPDTLSASLTLGVLDSRPDLERWAAYLGSAIDEDGGSAGDIPRTEHEIRMDDRPWGARLRVHAQIQPDRTSEVERLRARIAELEAQQSTGGAA
ncbi:hypothetical protein AB0875_12740 [Micromonospora gifhornensis]|uniref:hypothetical protein n=1 Tax=Micromonospora gifhornensis TaxID=84594 RepID=UPI0034559A1D